MSDENENPILSQLIDDTPEQVTGGGRAVNAVYGVDMKVQVVIGRASMPVSQLLSMARGSVIELDKKIGQPVDVMVNDRLIARGELVKVGEESVGVKLTEVIKEFVTKTDD